MSESRSRLGLGLPTIDSRHASQESNGLDLYYNSRPPDSNTWGYQPPPPVITEQPKSSMQHFQPYERSYPNTLESLAEKVHSFALPGRRMSAGGQPLPTRYVMVDPGFATLFLPRFFCFLLLVSFQLFILSSIFCGRLTCSVLAMEKSMTQLDFMLYQILTIHQPNNETIALF